MASTYAQFRPTYPSALFNWLAELVPNHDLAWDCAAGSGQASVDLAKHFKKVVATDASEAQLKQATPHPKIDYRLAPAENSGLPNSSVDLITVAQALHWFDLDRFYTEVRRVSKRNGVLAVWCYGVFRFESEAINTLVQDFYNNIVGPYWAPERRHVESGYQTLPFPFNEISSPHFEMKTDWTLAQLLGYFRSWSATVRFIAECKFDPVQDLEKKLISLWGPRDSTRAIHWPLAVRAGKVLI